MEYLVHNLGVHKGMESSRCSSAKVERKIIEKNRRNLMKNLYSKLNSLLQNSKEPFSLSDQIDEAVNYIKSLQKKLKESKEKKESLIGRKRCYRCTNSSTAAASLKFPEISINELGSAMDVALITEPESQFMFYEMIRILNEEGAQVLNANFSVVGNMGFYTVHAQIGGFAAAKLIKEKLSKLAQGSSIEQELQQELSWDYEIHPDTWDFPIM